MSKKKLVFVVLKHLLAKIKPDIGFAVDVGIAGDTPGITAKESTSKMGAGPQIVLFDASMVSHKGLRDFVVDTAEENNIPYQFETIPGGGTDAGSMHISVNGVPSLRLVLQHAIYIHMQESCIEMIMKIQ